MHRGMGDCSLETGDQSDQGPRVSKAGKSMSRRDSKRGGHRLMRDDSLSAVAEAGGHSKQGMGVSTALCNLRNHK